MQEKVKYVVFRTKWGWFGLAADKKGLIRTCLPHQNRRIVSERLLAGFAGARQDRTLLRDIQDRVIAYFAGKKADFNTEINVSLEGLSPFVAGVLAFCRRIGYGQTATYADLARKLGRPRAARAVGNALADNPIPLIIPCHRVLRSDGTLGGFSAPGGVAVKAKLLALERLPAQ